ncbi:Kv channel-interacting protein 2 isoform X1 [Pezoporus flaviventris]|uniref:Kv channel-interacting protein 2 isoform X1 n=1 Tax=Pezoporus flaviventris TaxID=889875 RepID=UPI002AAFA036|nr:Kv channel-interacting protein 2 isoform X1 [Pezoporus flaviventris]
MLGVGSSWRGPASMLVCKQADRATLRTALLHPVAAASPLCLRPVSQPGETQQPPWSGQGWGPPSSVAPAVPLAPTRRVWDALAPPQWGGGPRSSCPVPPPAPSPCGPHGAIPSPRCSAEQPLPRRPPQPPSAVPQFPRSGAGRRGRVDGSGEEAGKDGREGAAVPSPGGGGGGDRGGCALLPAVPSRAEPSPRHRRPLPAAAVSAAGGGAGGGGGRGPPLPGGGARAPRRGSPRRREDAEQGQEGEPVRLPRPGRLLRPAHGVTCT